MKIKIPYLLLRKKKTRGRGRPAKKTDSTIKNSTNNKAVSTPTTSTSAHDDEKGESTASIKEILKEVLLVSQQKLITPNHQQLSSTSPHQLNSECETQMNYMKGQLDRIATEEKRRDIDYERKEKEKETQHKQKMEYGKFLLHEMNKKTQLQEGIVSSSVSRPTKVSKGSVSIKGKRRFICEQLEIDIEDIAIENIIPTALLELSDIDLTNRCNGKPVIVQTELIYNYLMMVTSDNDN